MLYVLLDWLRDWLGTSGLYSYVQILERLEFRALAGVLLAFGIVLVLGKRVIAWLRRMKIGDTGMTDAAGLAATANSKRNTPTMGGVLIIGAVLGATLLLADIRQMYVILAIIVALWLAVLGGFDDWLKLTAARRPGGSRQGLYAWEKLVFQLGVGLLVGYFVYHVGARSPEPNVTAVLNVPLQRTWDPAMEGSTVVQRVAPGLLYLPAGLFVLVGVMMIAGMSNAVNITDGMDGLAAGTSAAVSLGLVALALIAGTPAWSMGLLVPVVPGAGELAVVAGAMGGACLGFLWFNCSPASVFMGDTGALSLGGLIGYIAIVTRQEVVVLFMSLVFLAEIGSVMLQVGYFKLSGGKRVFKVAPYHHHLHMVGWTEGQVVARFWIITVLLVIVALASLKVR